MILRKRMLSGLRAGIMASSGARHGGIIPTGRFSPGTTGPIGCPGGRQNGWGEDRRPPYHTPSARLWLLPSLVV